MIIFFFKETTTTEIYTYLHTLSLHDALPISHPRATLWWRTEPRDGFPCAASLDGDAAHAVASLWQQLVTGMRPSEDDLLPDEPPAPWRGKGDHGQGGEGMMGGKPYGRPMAMTEGDRRDGLARDARWEEHTIELE